MVLELVLEFIIRPAGYYALKLSDKAYSPTTARHINAFHLFFEIGALALFVPQLFCVANQEQCGESIPLSLVDASYDAVMGFSYAEVAYGRFILGLTFLRTFALVRHWKQMWINATFEGLGANGPESGEHLQINWVPVIHRIFLTSLCVSQQLCVSCCFCDRILLANVVVSLSERRTTYVRVFDSCGAFRFVNA